METRVLPAAARCGRCWRQRRRRSRSRMMLMLRVRRLSGRLRLLAARVHLIGVVQVAATTRRLLLRLRVALSGAGAGREMRRERRHREAAGARGWLKVRASLAPIVAMCAWFFSLSGCEAWALICKQPAREADREAGGHERRGAWRRAKAQGERRWRWRRQPARAQTCASPLLERWHPHAGPLAHLRGGRLRLACPLALLSEWMRRSLSAVASLLCSALASSLSSPPAASRLGCLCCPRVSLRCAAGRFPSLRFDFTAATSLAKVRKRESGQSERAEWRDERRGLEARRERRRRAERREAATQSQSQSTGVGSASERITSTRARR